MTLNVCGYNFHALGVVGQLPRVGDHLVVLKLGHFFHEVVPPFLGKETFEWEVCLCVPGLFARGGSCSHDVRRVMKCVLVIGYDAFPSHDLEHPSVNAVVPNLGNEIDFLFCPIFNNNFFRVIQNGSVGDLLDSTPPSVIVHRCVSHVSLWCMDASGCTGGYFLRLSHTCSLLW